MKSISTLLTVLFSISLSAQVANNYSFSQTTAPFNYLTNGTILALGTQDDNTYVDNIGFPFTYNNLSFTQFRASVNGFLVMGTATVPINFSPLSIISTGNIISAMGADLVMGHDFIASGVAGTNQLSCSQFCPGLYVNGGVSGPGIPSGTYITAVSGTTVLLNQNLTSNSNNGTFTLRGEIRYDVIGTSPNRQCIIQWRTLSHQYYPEENCYSFQIVLHETSGTIEINYDVVEVFGTSPFEAQVGLRGTLNSDINAREGSSGWQQTSLANNNFDFVELSNSFYPPQGLRFVWQNVMASVNENEASFQLHSFPNPASDNLNLVFPLSDEELYIDVICIDGRHLLQQTLPAGITTYTMDISMLKPGSYVFRFQNKNATVTRLICISEE
jgi:Secretion system C-terminal sorting domain